MSRPRRAAAPLARRACLAGLAWIAGGVALARPVDPARGAQGSSPRAAAAAPAVSAVPAPAPPPLAGLVVAGADGAARTVCVALDGEVVTGADLLRRSGLDVAVEATALGTLVCRIGDDGCDFPAEPCWCACRILGGSCRYWSYSTLEDGRWRYAILGAAARIVAPGDVDGWAWGEGNVVRGAEPPVVPFATICADRLAAAAPPAGRPPPAPAGTPDATAARPPAGAPGRGAATAPARSGEGAPRATSRAPSDPSRGGRGEAARAAATGAPAATAVPSTRAAPRATAASPGGAARDGGGPEAPPPAPSMASRGAAGPSSAAGRAPPADAPTGRAARAPRVPATAWLLYALIAGLLLAATAWFTRAA